MPETVSGQSIMPSHSDSEQPVRDTLARLEAQMEMLTRSVAELATWVTERADAEAEAEAILRRASPDRPRRPVPPRRGRRGDTFLRGV